MQCTHKPRALRQPVTAPFVSVASSAYTTARWMLSDRTPRASFSIVVKWSVWLT